MGYRKKARIKLSPLLQIASLILILVSVYFVVKLVQKRQSLSSSAAVNSTAIANAILSFSSPTPPNPQSVGSSFTTNVLINTSGQEIFGVDAVIIYNPAMLQVVSVVPVSGNGFTSYPSTRFNNNKGEILLSANIGTGSTTPVSGSSINVATVTFGIISPITNTSISYDFTLGNRNDSNIVPATERGKGVTDILGSVTPLQITTVAASPSPSPSLSPSPSPSQSPSPSPSPSLSPSPSPSPSPTTVDLSLTLSLQGKILTDLLSLPPITLTYVSTNFPSPQTKSLTLDSTGNVELVLAPDNYIFLLKSPSYLKRRYGSTDTPIIITGPSAIIDFTADPLLGGDFNDDGLINEIDYTLKFVPAFASTDPLIDLDGSGQVNNLDFAIMRSNWGLTDDIL